jgi:hypothetical protein
MRALVAAARPDLLDAACELVGFGGHNVTPCLEVA